MPSARWRHAASDYSHANAHAVAPIAPPYARAHAIAWRGPYTAHLCANETDVATQRMSACPSQCDGDRIHPVRGRNGPAPPLRPPSSRPPPAWPAKPDRTAALQSPARAQPPTQILGVRKGRKFAPRDSARIERAFEFGPCDGAGVQVRGAKRDGGARWRACGTWGVQPAACIPPLAATLKNNGLTELALARAHLRALRRAHVGALQHTCSLTTVPSARWRHAVSDYSHANAHAASLPPAVRTRTRHRMARVLHSAPLCE